MTSQLGLRELNKLNKNQLACLGKLELPADQIEFGGTFQSSIDECLAAPSDYVRGFSILLGETPIGMLLLKRPPWSPEWASETTVTLHGIKIDTRWQGKGYGRKAFEETILRARQIWPTAKGLALSVDAENAVALSVYRGFGMTDSGPVFRGRIGLEHRLETAFK